MKTFKKLSRILKMPYGALKGVLKLANNSARDLENKQRFSKSYVEGDCSFTVDSTVGQNSHIQRGSIVNHSHIGNYTYISRNSLVQNAVIGNYCSISHEVNIGLGAHPLHLFSTSPIFYRAKTAMKVELFPENYDFDEYKSISIGSDVWIGAKAIIMDGMIIGHGAVIAAGAIVTKNVPPYAIVGGVPAKIIKYRFTDESRKLLLESKWWEQDAEYVYSQRHILNNTCKFNQL